MPRWTGRCRIATVARTTAPTPMMPPTAPVVATAWLPESTEPATMMRPAASDDTTPETISAHPARAESIPSRLNRR